MLRAREIEFLNPAASFAMLHHVRKSSCARMLDGAVAYWFVCNLFHCRSASNNPRNARQPHTCKWMSLVTIALGAKQRAAVKNLSL